MREIKFRAFDKRENKMYEWNEIFFTDMSPVTRYDSRFPNEKDDDIILMQYTGLKDKNLKPIFEGDIVNGLVISFGEYKSYCSECYGEVHTGWYGKDTKYNNTFPFPFSDLMNGYKIEEMEIQGNIYESPELIK